MRVVEPSFEFISSINWEVMLKNIELYGRVCYKSEQLITENSSRLFTSMLIQNGHESVLEHEKITVKIICDRGVSHELVRHRIASYSQESTRYCNYTKDKFGNEITVIKPIYWNENEEEYKTWLNIMVTIEDNYNKLIELGAKPEEARSILPNSLKTEIIVTMNLREWRHFFKLRTDKKAHPQMRQLARTMLDRYKELLPIVFDDIIYEN